MKKIAIILLLSIIAVGCTTITPQEKHIRKRCMELSTAPLPVNETIHPYEKCKRLVRAQNEEPDELFNDPNGYLFSIQYNHKITYENRD